MMRLVIVVICLTGFIKTLAHVPDSLKFSRTENQVNQYFETIYGNNTKAEKIRYNDSILHAMENMLRDTSSFFHPFDSIQRMGVLKSPDGLFRIYTWALPLSPSNYQYHGFIQYYSKQDRLYNLYILRDSSAHIQNPEQAICSEDNWYGALYYEIIAREFRGIKLYTLLGFDFNDITSRKKIIEILTFNNDSTLQFGYPAFRSNLKIARRIVFEYSAKAVMTLTYDENAGMIVYDHLSPPRPSMEGHYEFYGPDFSYDAFYFGNGYWNYKADVDIRNPKAEEE